MGVLEPDINVEILADYEDELLDRRAIEIAELSAHPQKRQCLKDLRISNLTHPKSLYTGWIPPLPVISERQVMRQFEDDTAPEIAGQTTDAVPGDDFTSFDLHGFSIYSCNTVRHKREFVPLHSIASRKKDSVYYFDGILSNGSRKFYVQRAPFDKLSIGNYLDKDLHSVDGEIWIQSLHNHKSDRWYRLLDPAPEYARYQEAFIWMANFAKYFVDYLHTYENVCLHEFRKHFSNWIELLHGRDEIFQKWRQQFPRTDFCSVVAGYPDFLWAESYQIDPAYAKHTIWGEVNYRDLYIIPAQPCRERRTIVTPFVFECFKNVEWGRLLKPVEIPGKQETSQGPTTRPFSSIEQLWKSGSFRIPKRIRAGDVIGISRDAETQWKDKNEIWFVYVQGIETTKAGREYIIGIWLYTPSETPCAAMNYPFGNELFMSDHCNCGDAKIWVEDVACIVSVDFFQNPLTSNAGFAVRQKYCHADAFFVTLKKSDFSCTHRSKIGFKSDLENLMERFKVGDTVLVEQVNSRGTETLEPVVIEKFTQENAKELVLCRQLLRRNNIGSGAAAPPNELVYSENFLMVPAQCIDRKCHIRFYSEEDRQMGMIPCPYGRNGTGDAFFISTILLEDHGQQKLVPLQEMPGTVIEGFDPKVSAQQPQLRGLDLFCGGGNFGRGLEEGGAMKVKWAVDYSEKAIYTYRANLEDLDVTHLFYGSVNDFLMRSIQGLNAEDIPLPGDVDFISAGSPCQGFSNANLQRDKIEALQNCSLVASVAAFVDYYRPKYAVLENVLGMARKGPSKQAKATGVDGNIFSQLLCTFVGLGYQVQYYPIDAWSYGSPQSRSRLFVSITAPGLPLPPHPSLSHSHPATIRDRSIGMAVNNLDFGARRFCLTPFEFLSIAEATSDLPDIGDGHVQTCIPFPDHRHSRIENLEMRALMSQIPRAPRGQGRALAIQAGRISRVLEDMATRQSRDYYDDDSLVDSTDTDRKRKIRRNKNSKPGGVISRAYTRIFPAGLIPTVTTTITPRCKFMGRWVHWDQHRTMTIMEARRAQGFPDHEVLVGSPADQWKIVGNSVARPVALAFGLALREAWLAGMDDQPGSEEPDSGVVVEVSEKSVQEDPSPQNIAAPVTEDILVDSSSSSPPQVVIISDNESDESDDPIVADELAGRGNQYQNPKLTAQRWRGGSENHAKHFTPGSYPASAIQISSAPPFSIKRRRLFNVATFNASNGIIRSSPLNPRAPSRNM
ncbi:S-adenosyl-L-methionine-dependent methyltransferase [Xylona heveae TC161]|uniref:Cytosine-specific methyltransferase n=1 Tax=Xylona heveae (strain CBS 132557 / TC161) TaxID=1328760 RepID=A0A165G862_XYLHT|nr:S-adenosyl-L-methionine-dependent methyltransferase [Xylona heveae TC161]KZF21853.1 S-adenosyl-L-methionine-dependent methyltransferase [Xylona heveae TC161]